MRTAPVARSISILTSVPHIEVYEVPIRLKSVGGNLTLVRSMRHEPAASAAHRERIDIGGPCLSPAIGKVACAQAQRLNP